jgi:hypothetical protein
MIADATPVIALSREGGSILRIATLLLIGAAAVASAGASPARAITPDHVQAAPSPNIVTVDRRCGEHRHYIRMHRDREGHLIRGHCVRDRRY